jgi:predicted transposase/invertase (TIGR01784 family)
VIRFADPKSYIAFKKVFGNEQKTEILISFLNAVLALEGSKEIDSIDILNPYQPPNRAYLKSSLLAARAKDKRGVTFIVEMQIEKVMGALKRFQYYAAKAYVSQIKRGEDYKKLNPVILIVILDYTAFEDEDEESGEKEYLSQHVFLNKETHKQQLKELELNFIELPKFTKKEEELTSVLEKWIYFRLFRNLFPKGHLCPLPYSLIFNLSFRGTSNLSFLLARDSSFLGMTNLGTKS